MLDALRSRLRGRGPAELGRLGIATLHHWRASLSASGRARAAADRAFDRRWGTDTSTGVSVHNLGIDRALIVHCRCYDPSEEGMLRDPVAMLGLDPAAHDFIDYGAGKGRAMMLAQAMGFRTVTGVELSARLCGIARANLACFASGHSHLPPASLVEGNAAGFTPTGKRIVAYFYNPFDATIMAMVRDRLAAALATGTQEVVVIYANPEHGHVFTTTGWQATLVTPDVSTFVARASWRPASPIVPVPPSPASPDDR